MLRSSIRLLGQLTRLDTCLIVFVCLAVPQFYASGDLYRSVLQSLPILTICMCGFVINDLHDIEKDRENHPNRPLASNQLSPFSASVVYFVLLGISLTLIKALVDLSFIYLYLLLLIGLINYNYIVLYIPTLKNIYVATVGTIPLLILASLIPHERNYIIIIGALFLFLFARELLMDVEDAAGDGETFVKVVGLESAQRIAFLTKAVGDILLATQASDGWGFLIVAILAVQDVWCFWQWKARARRGAILFIMKTQLLLGIYYLV